MARSLWRGSLSFGLVNVPVALFSAVRDTGVHFNQVDAESGARLHVVRVCKEEDKEIEYDEIAAGYPRSEGEGYVMLSDEEMAAAAPEKTRTIDISEFVALDEIDPIYFDHPYWLVPVGDGEGPLRAYRLLVEAMSASGGLVAIGRFVLRTKEYLVALRVRDGLLSLNTMLFADEPTARSSPISPAAGIVLVAAPSMPGGRLKPKSSAISTRRRAPTRAPSGAKTLLHDSAKECISVPPHDSPLAFWISTPSSLVAVCAG